MIWSDVHVFPTLRGLLVALILACAGVVLSQMPAHACNCVDASVKQHTKRADLVFSGVLLESSKGAAGTKDRKSTLYDIEAATLYKGNLTTQDVEVVSSGNTTCGLGILPADRRYLFFVAEEGDGLVTDKCSGTARAGDQLMGRVENVLGAGTDLTPREDPPPPEPVVVEFTKVADAEPETLPRLAAPGAALVLLGLLGLFVVRRATARD